MQDESRGQATIDPEARMRALEEAELAIESAYATGRADRATITQEAQNAARQAVELAGEAMEADELADDATRMAIIAERTSTKEKARTARQKEREARKKANSEHKAATKAAREAYDAIRFSAPNKMGFMRAVQVIFAAHIFTYIVFLALTSRDAMAYNVTSIMDWVMVILEGVAFWMFINRYKIARPFVMGMAGVGLLVPAIDGILAGSFHPLGGLISGWYYVFLIVYFATSKRVKATLVNDFSQHKGTYDKDTFTIKRSGWPFYRNLGIYFVIFSVLGHWMEMAMCQLIIAGLVEGEYDPTNTMLWRDWLYPFPMEGAAVVIIALLLYPLLQWLKRKYKAPIAYTISFFANALTCTLIEFSMGLLVNADYQLWDYRENFGNFMGQVCLQNALAFGVAASIIAWFVYPMLERWIARVPRDIMNIVFVVVLVFGGIIWSLYIVEAPETNAAATQKVDASTAQLHQMEYQLWSVDGTLDGMEQTIQTGDQLNQEELQDEVDDMRDLVQRMMDTLGIDSLPTDDEALRYMLE